jgi:hypothetical protein
MKALGFEHAPVSCHHRAILTLDDAILLRSIGRCLLPMHALSYEIICKLPHGELTSAVSAECPQLQAGLVFRPRLDLLDSSHCTILGGDHDYSHVPTEVIYEKQEVLVTPGHRWYYWTTQVIVHQHQASSLPVMRLHLERGASLLPSLARLTQVLHQPGLLR